MSAYCIYDCLKCQIVHLGLYDGEDDCWRVYLGWPTRGEVRAAKKRGLCCLPVTCYYQPPELTPCDANAAKG